MIKKFPQSVIFLLAIIFLFFGLVLPTITSARVGVGVAKGKIIVNDPLLPGGIYEIPDLPVVNTGDEPSNYKVRITYLSSQPELRPGKEWFSFEPKSLYLEPGRSQNVKVVMVLPVKVEIGDYFCYIEAYPIIGKEASGTGAIVTIAAASKFYFTVKPANVFQAIHHRIKTFFALYSPWSWIVLVITIAALILTFFKRHFAFEFKFKLQRKDKKTDSRRVKKKNKKE